MCPRCELGVVAGSDATRLALYEVVILRSMYNTSQSRIYTQAQSTICNWNTIV
jgi:hypothetical protein